MTLSDKKNLREFIRQSLQDAGDNVAISDDDSLFASGRLDSLSMTQLVLYLEKSCGINFANVTFDADLIDSINQIEAFVDSESED